MKTNKLKEKIAYYYLNQELGLKYAEISDALLYYNGFEKLYTQFCISNKIQCQNLESIPSTWNSLHEEKLLIKGEPDFPKRMAQWHYLPQLIYTKGELQVLHQDQFYLGIVGTRQASAYALELCQEIVRAVSSLSPQTSIVSGLAFGIDACSHRAAINNKLRCIGVLPCSIEQTYPRSHKLLYDQVLEDGIILSQFHPQTKIEKGHFLMRNQLIAALSDVLLVVEAPYASGALNTARSALDMGKEVYVVPGSYKHSKNRGAHQLVNQGARLLCDPKELFQFGFENYLSNQGPRAKKIKKPCKDGLS